MSKRKNAKTRTWTHRPYKTARCVLQRDTQFLLAVHSSFWGKSHRRWGLPGGGIERGEDPFTAAQRELEEELEVYVADLLELGSYSYKGHEHMVYGTTIEQQHFNYDDTELLDLRWFDMAEVEQMAQAGDLHAGYELRAIETFLQHPRR